MIRIALILTALAAPAAAQTTGACRDGALWWANGAESGVLRLTCIGGATALRFVSPDPVARDQRGTIDLTVDGRTWRLAGVGADDAQTGQRILAAVALQADALDALVAGNTARLDGPAATRSFDLSGSGAALRALEATC